jgi:hypothetical protein
MSSIGKYFPLIAHKAISDGYLFRADLHEGIFVVVWKRDREKYADFCEMTTYKC